MTQMFTCVRESAGRETPPRPFLIRVTLIDENGRPRLLLACDRVVDVDAFGRLQRRASVATQRTRCGRAGGVLARGFSASPIARQVCPYISNFSPSAIGRVVS